MQQVQDQLWLDRPDAIQTIDSSSVEEKLKNAARALVTDGLAVLRGWHDKATCVQVIKEYQRWCAENHDYVSNNLDANGHEKRLCNFHLCSEAASSLGNNHELAKLLDYLFGYEASIYTSLTFKYGTQQPVHRDTPHFATWPPNYFFGVWVALDDVHPDSGPLFYIKNAHRFGADPKQFWDQAVERIPEGSAQEKCLMALDLYNGYVIRKSSSYGEPLMLDAKAGDTVIWHPQTPHGGSLARNPELPRWSIVFHCAPAAIQVHQHDAFFTHHGDKPPPPRYGFIKKQQRRVANAGGVSFM